MRPYSRVSLRSVWWKPGTEKIGAYFYWSLSQLWSIEHSHIYSQSLSIFYLYRSSTLLPVPIAHLAVFCFYLNISFLTICDSKRHGHTSRCLCICKGPPKDFRESVQDPNKYDIRKLQVICFMGGWYPRKLLLTVIHGADFWVACWLVFC